MKPFFAGIIFALCGSAATAAAAPTEEQWTGFYLGGSLGEAWGKADLRTTAALAGPGSYFQVTTIPVIGAVGLQDTRLSGVEGGITGGYDWQTRQLVLGFETGFDYLSLRGNSTGTAIYPCCAPTGFSIQSSVRSNLLFTARPRIGWAHDGLLLYVSGGLAMSRLNSSFTFADDNSAAAASGTESSTALGYAIGSGVEARFGNHWTAKAEYLYIDLGRVSATSANLTSYYGPSPLNVFTHSADLTANLARLGVSYRF